ncbi:MAG: hypothetical protein Q9166_005491 [cf. Caloplaca sp. 2 TL-2023]
MPSRVLVNLPSFGLSLSLKVANRHTSYTCGVRWRTCACTEEDQARRARQIRENLKKIEAEARAEEEGIRAAIAAVAEAERQPEEARREEERRQEEERAEEKRQVTMREFQRVENIVRHYNRLREILENGPLKAKCSLDTTAPDRIGKSVGQRKSTPSRDFGVDESEDREKAKNHSKLPIPKSPNSANVTPMKLIRTRTRHRKDEDDFFSKIITESDVSQDTDPLTKLEALL